MVLALNNLQRLICLYIKKPNQTKPYIWIIEQRKRCLEFARNSNSLTTIPQSIALTITQRGHPHQVKCNTFTLYIEKTTENVFSSCHLCASIYKAPTIVKPQAFSYLPRVIGISWENWQTAENTEWYFIPHIYAAPKTAIKTRIGISTWRKYTNRYKAKHLQKGQTNSTHAVTI